MSVATGPCTRHYHSDLSLWLSVDPMSDKYPSTSPYTYCANNPVKLVDPDGRKIWVVGEDGKKYLYKNRHLYDEHDFEEWVSPDSYEGKVLEHLNDLANSKDERITDRLHDLETSDYSHIISRSKIINSDVQNGAFPDNKKQLYIPKKEGGGCGSTIYYNPDYKIAYNDGAKFYGPAVLAHELLGHGWDYDQGLTSREKTSNGIPYKEVNAVNIQNIILIEHGYQMRTQYGIGDPTHWENIPEDLLNTYFTTPNSRP